MSGRRFWNTWKKVRLGRGASLTNQPEKRFETDIILYTIGQGWTRAKLKLWTAYSIFRFIWVDGRLITNHVIGLMIQSGMQENAYYMYHICSFQLCLWRVVLSWVTKFFILWSVNSIVPYQKYCNNTLVLTTKIYQ